MHYPHLISMCTSHLTVTSGNFRYYYYCYHLRHYYFHYHHHIITTTTTSTAFMISLYISRSASCTLIFAFFVHITGATLLNLANKLFLSRCHYEDYNNVVSSRQCSYELLHTCCNGQVPNNLMQ